MRTFDVCIRHWDENVNNFVDDWVRCKVKNKTFVEMFKDVMAQCNVECSDAFWDVNWITDIHEVKE